MSLKRKLRRAIFLLIGQKNVDYLRCFKFSRIFSKFSKIRDKERFVKDFSASYELEMQIIPRILKNPRTIIDVGANYGTYSFFLSKIYPQTKIIAFEPGTSSYTVLRRIIKKFGLKNVFPVKKGLGNKDEDKEIIMPAQYTIIAYVSDKNTPKKKGDTSENIQIVTLDSFVKKNDIKDIDFIKCDVEGFELNVFEGAKKTLSQMKPTILVEIEERHTKKYNLNPQQVMSFMKKLGYNAYSVKGTDIVRTEAVAKEIPSYLFVHQDKITH